MSAYTISTSEHPLHSCAAFTITRGKRKLIAHADTDALCAAILKQMRADNPWQEYTAEASASEITFHACPRHVWPRRERTVSISLLSEAEDHEGGAYR
ncbi:MAG: hypothetical protein JOY71_09200 [Acetobacteraceae bacterium]|nr:hypothetical protein [Acetobacteraceae bacterium]